jgi:hypothetical protein
VTDKSGKEPRIVRSEEISEEERERLIAETLQATEAMTDDDIDTRDHRLV